MARLKAPSVSLAERDRRWARIRSYIAENGYGALVIAGLRGREGFEAYVSNEGIQGFVVFPAEGEPIHLTWIAFRVIGRDDPQNDREYWIRDLRSGMLGPLLADTLRELGLDGERVGVVGLNSRGPMELEGFIPYSMWQHVLDALPAVGFEDASPGFSYLMLQKSGEELALARFSAEVGELACQTMLEVVRAGVSEADIYAEVLKTMYQEGVTLTPPSLIVKTGRDALSWGPPEWGVGAVAPRVLGEGELLSSELMPCYGGVETQQQMMMATNPIDPRWRELEAVARRSYDAGLEALKPGNTFVEVCDAMAKPLREAGCWHLSPLIHSVSPAYLLGTLHEGAEAYFAKQYPWLHMIPAQTDAVLQEGMMFAFEPNACVDRTRVNIGGTLVVGSSGPEELNKIPLAMHVV